MIVRVEIHAAILFFFLSYVKAYLTSSAFGAAFNRKKLSTSSPSLLLSHGCIRYQQWHRRPQYFLTTTSFLNHYTTRCRQTCEVVSFNSIDHHENKVVKDTFNETNNAEEQTSITTQETHLPTDNMQIMLMEKKNQETIRSFIDQVNKSIQNDTFTSITLRGVSKQRSSKTKNNHIDAKELDHQEQNQSELRGSIRYVTGRLITLQRQPSRKRTNNRGKDVDNQVSSRNQLRKKLHVTFKYYYATDIVKNWDIFGNNTEDDDDDSNDVTNGLGILFNVHALRKELEQQQPSAISSNNNNNFSRNNLVPVSEWYDGSYNHNHGIESASLELVDGTYLQLTMESRNTIPSQFKIRKVIKKQEDRQEKKLDKGNNTNNNVDEEEDNRNSNNDIFSHDRTKQFPVPLTEPFWHALGMMTVVSDANKNNNRKLKRQETESTEITSSSSLTVKPAVGMSSKIKQCQKFVEIVDRLIEQRFNCNNKRNNKSDNSENTKRNISVVDMGCGRGYLTFALHCFLQTKYGSTRSSSSNDNAGEVPVQSLGIDVRPKLVHEINSIAQKLGLTDNRFSNHTLRFETGTIEQYVSLSEQQERRHVDQQELQPVSKVTTSTTTTTLTTTKETTSPLNVLIALHACDTATDDAIWFGIRHQIDVIVVAPCCHKQLRSQLDTYVKTMNSRRSSMDSTYHPMADILRHNIYRERMSETITDSLRALLLELAGYSVQVFEFIGGEHTSKNVMITGVLLQNQQHSQQSIQQQQHQQIRERIRSLCTFYGIKNQKLALWMNETLLSYNNNCNDDDTKENDCHDQYDPAFLLTKKPKTIVSSTSMIGNENNISFSNSRQNRLLEQTRTRKSMLSNRIGNEQLQDPSTS